MGSIQRLPAIRFEKGCYVVTTGQSPPVSIERCRFHWLGWLLLCLGRTQQVSVNGKKTYVYLKKDAPLEALFARIKGGRGKDLGELVAGRINVPAPTHKILKAMHPKLPFFTSKTQDATSYSYSLHELAAALGLSEKADPKDFERTLLEKTYPLNEAVQKALGDNRSKYHEALLQQMDSTEPIVDFLGLTCLILRKKSGVVTHIFPLEQSESFSTEDIKFYRCQDLVTGMPYMVKMGVTSDGIAGVASDHVQRRVLEKHPGLLHLKKQLPAKPGQYAVHISPAYEKGDLTGQKNLSTDQLKSGLLSIMEALAYLHKQEKYHGDVKRENILVGDQWVLCDFETVGRFPDQDEKHWRHSPPYVGKEDKKRLKILHEDLEWNQKLDVAALGLLVVYLCKPNISTIQYPSLKAIIERLEETKNLPPEWIPLLTQMLEPDYKKRITIQGALEQLYSLGVGITGKSA